MAAFFTVLLGLSAVLLGYFLYDFGRQNFIRETEAAIDSEIEQMLGILKHKDGAFIETYIAQKADEKPNPVYLYIAPDERILAGNIEDVPDQVERIKEGIIGFHAVIHDEEKTLAAKIHTFGDGSRLLIARDITAIEESYDRLQWLSTIIMVFMLIVVLVSFFISVFVVSRINLIARTAQQIMQTGDLSKRISIEGNWDDLSHLAQILNAMFARVEELMEGVRDVSDSIAHDLRTPLTRLRHQLEQNMQKKTSKQDMEILIAEADSLLETFNSLLRISNIEKGKRHQQFETVNVVSVMQDVVELYEPLSEEKKITIKLDACEHAQIRGDKHLLFQLFANLLDNAVKFSPEKTSVTVEVKEKQKGLEVSIADQGFGLSKDEMEKVFQRFYRADKSRNSAGNGLGLSLVKAIIELHKAKIHLEDNAPGLRVRITFL